MEEQASFETRAVLAPRRARRARLALLLPIVAFGVVAWAGSSGNGSGPASADVDAPRTAPPSLAAIAPSSSALPPVIAAPGRPSVVLGLDVHRLDELHPATIDRDTAVAIRGWYVATAIEDCPPVAVIYRDGSLPEIRPEADPLAYCDRAGILYASRPDLVDRLPTNNLEDNRAKNSGLPAIDATMVVGVVAPPEIELVSGQAVEVALIGQFIDGGRSLIIDYVGWTGEA